MTERIALVLGGTGMLAGCATALLNLGWQVVLPSRRPRMGMAARASLGPRGQVPAQRNHPFPVVADWARPDELAARVRDTLNGNVADLLVAWVHASYREPVLRAVAPLLAEHAPVVEVHDSSGIDPVRGMPDPLLEGHPTQQVVLGHIRHGGSTRWLTHEETSVGVLEAVHRAIEGKPPSLHQIGDVDTWVVRH